MKKDKSRRSSPRESQTGREDRIVLKGIVDEALPGTLFRVIADEHVILVTLSGKLRLNHIRILPGDIVEVEVCPYQTTKGRIIWRR